LNWRKPSPIVEIIGNIVAASRKHPDVALKFAARRWPERLGPSAALSSTESEAGAPLPSVATAMVTIPADQVPEFGRRLIEAKRRAAAAPPDGTRAASSNAACSTATSRSADGSEGRSPVMEPSKAQAPPSPSYRVSQVNAKKEER
jgi:hypothetical protein